MAYGMLGAPFIGLPGSIAGHVTDWKAAEALYNSAPSFSSKESFIMAFKDSGFLENESTENIEKYASGMYDKAVQDAIKRKAEVKKTIDEIIKKDPVEGNLEPVRNANGNLRIETEVTQDDEGEAQKILFTAGNAYGKDRYVEIEVENTPESVVITDASVSEGYGHITSEVIANIAASYPGKPLIVSPMVDDKSVLDAWNEATNSNPYGKEMGASWSKPKMSADEYQARDFIRNNVAKINNIVDAAERELFVELVGIGADMSGSSYASHVDKVFGEGFINKEGEFGVDNESYMEKNSAVGLASFSSKTFADGAKALIFVSKKGNFSTLVHEYAHVIRVANSESEYVKKLGDMYGVKDGKWEKAHEEQFVSDLMSYISDDKSKVLDEKKKAIISRIASYLKRLWNNVISRDRANVKPEIAKIFDEWISRDEKNGVVDQEVEYPEVVEAEPNSVYAEAVRKSKAGEALTEEEKGYVELGKMMSDDYEKLVLLMSKDEIKNQQPENYAMSQAIKYKTFDSWLLAIQDEYESSFGNRLELSDKDLKYFKDVWVYSRKKSPRKFNEKGDFSKFIQSEGNANDFIGKIADAITSPDDEISKRVRTAISQTPEISRVVNKYIKSPSEITEKDMKDFKSYISKNEALSKNLYASITNDSDLAIEAMNDMGFKPSLNKKRLVSSPSNSMAYVKEFIDDVADADLKKKIRSGKATVTDLNKYIKRREEYWKDIDKSAKSEAREGARILRDKAKQRESEIHSAYRERAAVRRTLQRMKVLKRFILKSRNSLSPEARTAISFIQEYVKGSGDIASIKSIRSRVFDLNPGMMDDLVKLLEDVNAKSVKDMTIEELETLASYIAQVERDGRRDFRNERELAGLRARARRNELEQDFISGEDYVEPATYSSEEGLKQSRGSKFYKFRKLLVGRTDLIARDLDGGKKNGKNYDLLYKENITCHINKEAMYAKRTAGVKDFILKNKMAKSFEDQFVIKGIGINDSDIAVSRYDLLGWRLLAGTETRFNQKQREALIYGDLFGDLTEKDPQASYRKNSNTYMMSKYEEKLAKVLAACNEHLTENDETLCDMMLSTMNKKEDKWRFIDTIMKLTGKEPVMEENYFTLMRLGLPLADSNDSILSALAGEKGGGFNNFGNSGMMIERKNIPPNRQPKIKTNALDIFFDSVLHQEHLIAYGEYVKKLRMIYGSANANGLKSLYEARYGHDMGRWINDLINSYANPDGFNENTTQGDALVKFFRAGTAMSYIGFRFSSFVAQMGTSPLPFLAHAPVELVQEYGVMLKRMNPVAYYQEVEKNSPFLASRQPEDMLEAFDNLTNRGATKLLRKEGFVAFKMFTFADRLSVAMGYEAVRKKFIADNAEKYFADGKSDLLEAHAHQKAAEVVTESQPMGNAVFRPSMYRNINGWQNVFLQFTQPLNVIYNNLFFDVPNAIKDKEFGKAVGYGLAYALSGLIMAAINHARGNGPDDEDDVAKYYIWGATSQVTDSLPLVGDLASGLTRALIAGDNISISDSNIPMLQSVGRAANTVLSDDKEWDAKFLASLEAIGVMTCQPVKATKEYVNMLKVAYDITTGE